MPCFTLTRYVSQSFYFRMLRVSNICSLSRIVRPGGGGLLLTTSFSTSVLASFKDKDAEKETRYSRKLRVKDNSLSKTVTPQLEKEIVGDSVGQRFILKQALTEIILGEGLKYPLPLPASLSVDQWRTLLTFTDRRSRFLSLDSLMFVPSVGNFRLFKSFLYIKLVRW